MTKEAHLESLKKRHAALDELIRRGFTTYLDDRSLNKMKNEKLKIKEQIVILEKELNHPPTY
jgi:hypothetical protein